MKKSKIIVLVAALLTAVFVLTSCGASTIALVDCLAPNATMADESVTYSGAAVVADLADMTYRNANGSLVYFTKSIENTEGVSYTKHVVYNMAAGAVVFTATNTKTSSYTITLYSDENRSISETFYYFTVAKSTWKLDEDDDSYGNVTDKALYDAKGNKVTDYTGSVSFQWVNDLCYFNGACYTVDEDGVFTKKFDWSPLAKLPEIDAKAGDYYYEYRDNGVYVYDAELKYVAGYLLPAYEDAELTAMTVLENGKVLVQYFYVTDMLAEDYTFMIEEGVKCILVTGLLNVEKGKFSEIDCAYMFNSLSNTANYAEEMAEMGINPEVVKVYGSANRIGENKLIDENSVMVMVDKKGDVTELEQINGENIIFFYLVADNRWVVSTPSHRYLINEKGEVLGDITNASTMLNYLAKDGKIYNYDLQVVYDYTAAHLSVDYTMENSILFTNADGDSVLYTGGSTLTTIRTRESDKSIVAKGNNYFVVYDYSDAENLKYVVYNDLGTVINTITVDMSGFGSVASCKDGAIIWVWKKVVKDDNDTWEKSYYRVG